MTKDKPIRVTVGDQVVEAHRVDVDRWDGWKDQNGLGRPKERSRLAVYVDGVHRGHLVYPSGWGGSWHAESLGPGDIEMLFSERDCRHPLVIRPEGGKPCKGNEWRDELLRHFPAFVRRGSAPSPDEIDARVAALPEILAERAAKRAAKAEREERERVERRARWDRENAERAAADAELRRQRQEEVEIIDGLLNRRNTVGLTNLEVDALQRIADRQRAAR